MTVHGKFLQKNVRCTCIRKFQHLISGTVASGELARPSTTKGAAVSAWFATGFIGLYLCYIHMPRIKLQVPTAWPTEAIRYRWFDRASHERGRDFLCTLLFTPEKHKTVHVVPITLSTTCIYWIPSMFSTSHQMWVVSHLQTEFYSILFL